MADTMKLGFSKNKKLSSIKMLSSGHGHIKTPQYKKREEDRDTDNRSSVSDNNLLKAQHHEGIRMENTYKMAPDRDQMFYSHTVEKLMKNILEDKLEGKSYEQVDCGALSMEVSTDIKSKVKELKWMRHKVVVQVVIGQNAQQSMRFGSRCLWDEKNDNHACAYHETNDLLAVASCFGVYCE